MTDRHLPETELARNLRYTLLVLRVLPGVHQNNGDRSDPHAADSFQILPHFGGFKLPDYSAAVIYPFVHLLNAAV